MLESLKAATFEVLETMFFIFPESLEEVATLFHGPGLRAWVPVEGPKSFRVGLTVPLPLALEMAANFLGLEKDEVPAEKLDDVLRRQVQGPGDMEFNEFLRRAGIQKEGLSLLPEVVGLFQADGGHAFELHGPVPLPPLLQVGLESPAHGHLDQRPLIDEAKNHRQKKKIARPEEVISELFPDPVHGFPAFSALRGIVIFPGFTKIPLEVIR